MAPVAATDGPVGRRSRFRAVLIQLSRPAATLIIVRLTMIVRGHPTGTPRRRVTTATTATLTTVASA